MPIADAITRQGFSRWYERELLRGHGHLLLLLLCTVALVGVVETFHDQHGSDRLLMLACLVALTVAGAWSLRRYLHHLGQAEALADQAVCPHCGSYARWAVEARRADTDGAALQVACRPCGGRWSLRC